MAAPPAVPDEQARNRIALSLVNQRQPDAHNWELVRMALLGATLDELVALDRRVT